MAHVTYHTCKRHMGHPVHAHSLIRSRLFEINDVVSKRFVKISNVNITNISYCIFLLEKCENLLHFSHTFPTKNTSVFDNVVSIYLTS